MYDSVHSNAQNIKLNSAEKSMLLDNNKANIVVSLNLRILFVFDRGFDDI